MTLSWNLTFTIFPTPSSRSSTTMLCRAFNNNSRTIIQTKEVATTVKTCRQWTKWRTSSTPSRTTTPMAWCKIRLRSTTSCNNRFTRLSSSNSNRSSSRKTWWINSSWATWTTTFSRTTWWTTKETCNSTNSSRTSRTSKTTASTIRTTLTMICRRGSNLWKQSRLSTKRKWKCSGW